MQCNQAFCGNALNSTQGMYPEIVGEGQVSSVTLPDGSVQFFFMPTLKWWSPNAMQSNPYPTIPNPMFAYTNYGIPPPCNNNIGSWFIRSISTPPFPQSECNSPSQRTELVRPAINTDCNHKLNSHDLGYHVKFHNDGWTSTTDLVYFYPSLRQHDFVFTPPCKDKTVQIDTEPVANNTVCNNEVKCSKPCCCSVGPKPMSLDSLVDPKLTPRSNNTSTEDSYCSKKHNKLGMVQKKKRNKSRHIICACGPPANIVSVDKSITTYADEGSSCTPADGRETQTCKSEESRYVDAKPTDKSLLKPAICMPKLTIKSYSGCCTTDECSNDECSNDDTSKAPNKRDEDKEYRRSKPKKCDCGSDSSANIDCCVSEDEAVASKDTPCTCSTCSSITKKKKSKRRSRGKQRTSSERNKSLQWLNSDNCVSEKFKPKGEETKELFVCPSSDTAMEGKSSQDLLENCSDDCDNVTSTCGR